MEVTVVDERKVAVLRAIVEDYVATCEPVGSKALVERHHLGVSPATVRNDMAALEDEGYITQPHTSAGRVPTDAGYRLFVDRLGSVKTLSAAERRAIQRFLDGAVDLDDIMTRTVRLLAQVTRSVAVVKYPSLTASRVRHVELVPVTASRLMVVVITTTGRVEQRVLELAVPFDDDQLGELRDRINTASVNRLLGDVPDEVDDIVPRFGPELRPAVAAVVSTLLESLVEESEDRVILAGTANLALFGGDFPDTIRPVLEALEEHVVLLHLLTDTVQPADVTVRIGHELPIAGLSATSVVATSYGESGEGRLGVVGPTRMDYPGTIGAVRAVARYVGRVLEESP
jgi:heat-inducible transcriptional repressor